MIRTVIVGLDGSELAEEALSYAIQIVQHTGARLQLCQVLPPDASAALKEAAETYLREIAHKLDHVLQLSIRLGTPAEELLANAQTVPEPIIVMTTQGRGGIGRLMWGLLPTRFSARPTCLCC
jgi:nucleotide-binding universal stress UspA family protein